MPINNIDPEGTKYAYIYANTFAAGAFVSTAAASIVVDAATGGINIIATPAELAGAYALGWVVGFAYGAYLDIMAEESISDPCLFSATGAKNKKYQKPPNPNRRKGAEDRQQIGERERNVRHPDGEEHSRRPKGGFKKR